MAVINTPYSNTCSVVESAIAEIISLARRLIDRDCALHQVTDVNVELPRALLTAMRGCPGPSV